MKAAKMETGRNDPCPCGSGKKYKKCCLQKDVTNEPSRALDFTYESNLVLRKKVTDKLDRLLLGEVDQEQALEFLEDYWSSAYLGLKEWEALRANPDTREPLEMQFPLAMRNAFPLDERLPAQYFLDECPEKFTKEELTFLRAFADAPLTYVQFREFFPEAGYSVAEDIFDGRHYRIFDKKISEIGKPHNIIGARLVPFPGKDGHVFELVADHVIRPDQKGMLLDLLAQEARDFAAAVSDGPLPDPITPGDIHTVLKEVPIIFYWVEMLLRYQEAFPGKPRITTTDGEEIVFINARFSCPDTAAMEAAFLNQRNFIRTEDEGVEVFRWLNKADNVLGTVRTDPKRNEILLETNSLERFRKWEKKLKSLGDVALLTKQEETLESIQSKELSEGPVANSFSPEEMAELAPQIQAQMAERWLKEKIPMLNGKTPVEASRTVDGRKKLRELFDYMENMEARRPEGMLGGFDLDKMKRRLGLKDD